MRAQSTGRWAYYFRSLVTLLRGVRNWYLLPWLPLRRGRRILHLRNGLSFRIRSLMDAWIIKETCLDRDYEVHGVPLQPGWMVVDIGAGLGDFTCFAAQRGAARIIACEPFADSFALLQENLQRNQVQGARPYPLAVGARSGTLTLTTAGAAVQHSTTDTAVSAPQTAVPALSLADLFAQEAVESCDFLKMDCEGGEYDILFHADDDTLGRIRHLCLEYHLGVTPYGVADLVAFLQAKGFRTRTAVNPVHADLGFLYAGR